MVITRQIHTRGTSSHFDDNLLMLKFNLAVRPCETSDQLRCVNSLYEFPVMVSRSCRTPRSQCANHILLLHKPVIDNLPIVLQFNVKMPKQLRQNLVHLMAVSIEVQMSCILLMLTSTIEMFFPIQNLAPAPKLKLRMVSCCLSLASSPSSHRSGINSSGFSKFLAS